MKIPTSAIAVIMAASSATAFVTKSFAISKSFATSRVRMSPKMAVSNEVYLLNKCKQHLKLLIDQTNSHPIMVRLAWHDAGTYDKNVGDDKWPKCGGANGSIRFDPERSHGANAGLDKAMVMLLPLKKEFPQISWADLIQMAGATAVEMAGGPTIDMKYGRVDAVGKENCSPEGNLPGAEPPFHDGAETPQQHLRNIFYRMGMNDQEIVALSGAHTIGRAHSGRSGAGKMAETKYTTGDHVARGDGKKGYGMPGGQSWTEKWLKFDNSYYQTVPDENADPELLKLSTDSTLFVDDGFLPHAQRYKNDQENFFQEYAAAHKKLSELGAKWSVEGGISLDEEVPIEDLKAMATEEAISDLPAGTDMAEVEST